MENVLDKKGYLVNFNSYKEIKKPMNIIITRQAAWDLIDIYDCTIENAIEQLKRCLALGFTNVEMTGDTESDSLTIADTVISVEFMPDSNQDIISKFCPKYKEYESLIIHEGSYVDLKSKTLHVNAWTLERDISDRLKGRYGIEKTIDKHDVLGRKFKCIINIEDITGV